MTERVSDTVSIGRRLNVLGVTLARGGSIAIPRKNMAILAGRPLIDYTVDVGLKCSLISEYVVSTDDTEIREHCLDLGASVPFVRPEELATSSATSAAALRHALIESEAFFSKQFDIVVELMATNPLKTIDDVANCINLLIATDADSVIAMHRLEDHHPARIKKIRAGKIVDFCIPETLESRRQDLKPKAYIRSGAIYALRRSEVLASRRYGTKNSRPYILAPEKSLNIDTPLDLKLAEMLLAERGEIA